MTGIHHTAPTTYLRATRRDHDAGTRRARRPSRLLQAAHWLAGRTAAAGLPRRVDVTPSAAR